MPVEKLEVGQYVKIVSVEATLLDTSLHHERIKKSIGTIHKVDTAADSLHKCILKDLDGIIYLYKDLEHANVESILPKGGTFDVENLVHQEQN